MNYLYINNQYITTLQGLKKCLLQEDVLRIGSSLFNELMEYYQSGEIADFLNDIGEEHVAERIRSMEIGGSDTKLMQQLVAAITGTEHDVAFDPMSCLEVVETTVKGNKAIFKLRVLKRVNEKPFEISISQPAKSLSKVELIDLSQHQQNDEIIVEMEINPYCDVCFWIGKEEKCRVNTESNAYRNCGTIEGIVDYLKRFPEGCHLGEIKARETVWVKYIERRDMLFLLLPIISVSNYSLFKHNYIKFLLFSTVGFYDRLMLISNLSSLMEQNNTDVQLNQYLVSRKLFHDSIRIPGDISAFIDDAIEFWNNNRLFVC